jgi:hypothetical protein
MKLAKIHEPFQNMHTLLDMQSDNNGMIGVISTGFTSITYVQWPQIYIFDKFGALRTLSLCQCCIFTMKWSVPT